MALDTNLTPEIVNSFNVYIDGVKAIVRLLMCKVDQTKIIRTCFR